MGPDATCTDSCGPRSPNPPGPFINRVTRSGHRLRCGHLTWHHEGESAPTGRRHGALVGGPEHSDTSTKTQAEFVDVMQAMGDVESLPMHLALSRTRAQLFGVHTAPTRLGRFELLEIIGRGATAVVHTAHDPQLDRVVALKVFPPGLDSATHARVMREARLAASFNHPNVVTVLDVGENRGRIWVAMERFEGQTLRDVLRKTPPGWAALAPLFLPIAMGLQEVHRQGIVHRDVKPENVLVDAGGHGVLTDFGVATLGPLDSEAGAGGTPAYMSPEQLDGGLANERRWSVRSWNGSSTARKNSSSSSTGR